MSSKNFTFSRSAQNTTHTSGVYWLDKMNVLKLEAYCDTTMQWRRRMVSGPNSKGDKMDLLTLTEPRYRAGMKMDLES